MSQEHITQQPLSPLFEEWHEGFMDAVYHLDKPKAQSLLEKAFSLTTPEEACLRLLQPALYHIGTLWHENRISWINENFASTLIHTALSQQLHAIARPLHGPRIFMSCVPQETHEIGPLMLALFWRRLGLNIIYKGQFVSEDTLFQSLSTIQPRIICLSAMIAQRAKMLVSISQQLQGVASPPPILCYGGGAFLEHSPLQKEILGYYLGPNASVATHNMQLLLQNLQAKA